MNLYFSFAFTFFYILFNVRQGQLTEKQATENSQLPTRQTINPVRIPTTEK